MTRANGNSEPSYRNSLKFAGVVLAGAAALAGCGNTNGSNNNTTPSTVATSSSPSPEISVTPSPQSTEKPTGIALDAKITGIKSDDAAVALLNKWADIYTKDATDTSGFIDNPGILIEAAGLSGVEAQTKALNAMANDLRITPEELQTNAQILLDQIKRVKPYIAAVRAEEQSSDVFQGVPITAASQYDTTRAFAYIITKINNGIVDGSIQYPEIKNNCDVSNLSESLTTTYTLADGKVATYSVLVPPLGVNNSVSYEARKCLNVASVEKMYSDSFIAIDKQNIKFAKDNGFPNEAKALAVFAEPVIGNNDNTNKLIAKVDG